MTSEQRQTVRACLDDVKAAQLTALNIDLSQPLPKDFLGCRRSAIGVRLFFSLDNRHFSGHRHTCRRRSTIVRL